MGFRETGNIVKIRGQTYIECVCDKCGIVKKKRMDRYIENGSCNALRHNHKHISELLSENEDDTLYTVSSSKKAEWKCPNCNTLFYQRVNSVVKRGISCPMCSRKRSFPNRFMYSLLKENGVEFEYEKSFSWNPNKKYDFYIKNLNMIIEMNGLQHYKDCLYGNHQSIRKNDKIKMDVAMGNGITDYVVVDASASEFDFMVSSILNSSMAKLIDLSNTDFNLVEMNTYMENLNDILKLWENGESTKGISNQLSLDVEYVIRTLKCANRCGLCKYDPYAQQSKIMFLQTRLGKGELYVSILGKYSNQ